MKVNIGSGPQRFEGWKNLDIDKSVKPDYVSGVDKLPFKDGSVEAIFASHVLEHIPFGVDIIPEWKRVLRVGGVLIIAVPDINQMLAMYQAGMVDLKYLHATVYGSQMYGHPKKTMTHYRIYTPVILMQELGRHFDNAQIGTTLISPRQMVVGEIMITSEKK